MQRFFTQNLLMLMFCLVSMNMMGQAINTLTITAPGIAGDYVIARAAFGSKVGTPFTAVAAFVNDGTATPTLGCNAPTNNLTGLVAFIDRGACTVAANGEFAAKALKAQTKGAIAVIVCNNLTNANQGVISMGIGATGAQVTVPSFMLSYADCQKIRTAVTAGGLSLAFSNKCSATYSPDVFWGNVPGQGDFNGGLNEWTIENADTALNSRNPWFWSESGDTKSGTRGFSSGFTTMTKCNGSAIMDIEALQLEDNPTLMQPYFRYNSSLISPALNCTGKNNVILQFTTLNNKLNGRVQISFFDGTEWGEAQDIPTDNSINVKCVSETISIPLPEFANKNNCRVMFSVVNSDFYGFSLDDVMLLNTAVVDVKVNKNWFAVAPILRVPKDQVSEMPFMADIENVGNTQANGTLLSVEIKNPAGTVVATVNNEYGAVAGSTTVENDVFDETYTPPAVVGKYTGSYKISATNEGATLNANNNADFEFYVTEKTFGNLVSEDDFGMDYLEDIKGSWVVDVNNYYSAGNVYYVENGNNKKADKVRFGLANASVDIGYVQVDLFELLDNTGITNPASRELVGTGEVFLEDIPNLRNIEVSLFAPNAEGVPSSDPALLKSRTNYFLTVNTKPLDPSFARYELLQYSGNGNDAFDRSIYIPAVNFAFDTLGIDRIVGSYWQRAGAGDDKDEIRSRSYTRTGNETFGSWANVYLEMDIADKVVSTYDIDKTAEVSTFPNPANRELYLDISLKNVSDVRVELVSMDGKIIMNQSFGKVQESRLKMDIENVASGAYSVLIHTDNGVITKKVIVQK